MAKKAVSYLNDEFDFQNESDFEQNSYWSTYFDTVRSKEQWADVELNKVSYAEEAADVIINPEPEMENGGGMIATSNYHDYR